MSTFVTIWSFIGKYKYVITILFFLVLVCFAGDDCLLANYHRHQEVEQMRQELNELRAAYTKDSIALSRLKNDPNEAEHVAREMYFMKRQGEDVFVFVDETPTPTTEE